MADLFKEEVQLNGAGVTVQLSKAGLLRWSGKRKNGTLMIPGDLIGFKELQEDASSIVLHTFCHCSSSSSMSHKLCGPRRGGGSRNRIRKDMLIKFANPASHKLFRDNIQEFLDACGRPKKLLVIVNPFGGDGVGRRVYMRTVEPLLQAAGITIIMKGNNSYYCTHFLLCPVSFIAPIFDCSQLCCFAPIFDCTQLCCIAPIF
jgi:hypothetical protein